MENSGFLNAFTDTQNLLGHVAYVLIILSMLMRSMRWLRIFAICSGMIAAVYYHLQDDPISVFWECLFTLVNLVQLAYLLWENRRSRFSEDEKRFIETCLGGIEIGEVRRLLALGAWTETPADWTLTVENEVPHHLKFIVVGECDVWRRGKLVGTIGEGDFVGEMSYLAEDVAMATVITRTSVRYLGFEPERLRQYLPKHPQVQHALEASFNRNLVEKLSRTNEAGNFPEQSSVAPSDNVEKGEEQ